MSFAYLLLEPGPEPGVPGGLLMPGGVCAGLPKSVCAGRATGGPSSTCHIASLTDCSTMLIYLPLYDTFALGTKDTHLDGC